MVVVRLDLISEDTKNFKSTATLFFVVAKLQNKIRNLVSFIIITIY